MASLLSFLGWEWRAPVLLWFVWIPLIWWWVSKIVRQRQISQYADSHLWSWVKVDDNALESLLKQPGQFSKSSNRHFLKPFWFFLKNFLNPGFLMSIAWISLVIALAGPRTAIPAPTESSRSGVDILFALDLSKSMTVQDLPPNRFLTARSLIESIVNRLEQNDRLGLMVYAGKPHLVSPLTFDRKLFGHYLTLLRPGMLPTMGSQIKPALVFGVEHLQQTAGKAKVLVVFTDGEPQNFTRQPDPVGLEAIPQSDVKIILVGVGENGRSRIPDPSHQSGFLHVNGLLVTSRLEEAGLQALATQMGANYVKAEKDKAFLDKILSDVTVGAEERKLLSSDTIWKDHAKPFVWILLVAVLFTFYPFRFAHKSAISVWVMVLALPFFQPSSVWAETQVAKQQEAFQAYSAKDYDEAIQLYDVINSYDGWFGAGASAYKNQDMESAVQYFRQAALMGAGDWQRAQALFNLGNSYFQANLMPQAIEAYEQALVYEPDYENAKHNLELAKQRRQQEMRGQQQQQDQDGEGQGQGMQSRDDSGAYYGGQRPDQNQAGEGVSGDSPEGDKDGKDFVLPDEEDRAEFTLQANQPVQVNDTGNAILDQQAQIRRIEAFEQKMQQVDDNQSELLIRLFERAEGFQARQTQSHPLPGVKPW